MHRQFHMATKRVSVYFIFTTGTLLALCFMFYSLVLGRERLGMRLGVTGVDGKYGDIDGHHRDTGMIRAEESLVTFENQINKPKKIIIIAYPRKFSGNS